MKGRIKMDIPNIIWIPTSYLWWVNAKLRGELKGKKKDTESEQDKMDDG